MRPVKSVLLFAAMLILALVFSLNALAQTPEEAYGYTTLATSLNAAGEQGLYREMYIHAERFASGNRDVSEADKYIVAALDYGAFGIDAYRAVEIWKIFFADYPEFYWMENRTSVSEGRLYMYVYAEYAAASVRRNTDRAIQAGKQLILSAANGLEGELSRAAAIHDSLMEAADYAYGQDGRTPSNEPHAHNIVGVLTGLGGVCDGYAKAYSLLLREIGIDCIFVDGVADGVKHAWNLLCIAEEWYWVDVTWDDMYIGSRYHYFGTDADVFLRNHQPNTPEGVGASHLYILPKVAKTAMQLTELSRDGQTVGLFESPSAALAAIPDGDAGAWKLRMFTEDGAERSYSLPEIVMPVCKSVVFSADNSGEPLLLRLFGDVSAGGNLCFENIRLAPAPELNTDVIFDMMGFSLTFTGMEGGAAAIYDENRVRISSVMLENTYGALLVNTDDTFYWDGVIRTESLTADGGTINVGAGHHSIKSLRILSDKTSFVFSDALTMRVTVKMDSIELGASCSIMLRVNGPGNALTAEKLFGGHRMALAVHLHDMNYYPDLYLGETDKTALDITVRTYREDAYYDPETGETVTDRLEADLTGFHGMLCRVKTVDLTNSSVYFILANRTVNLSGAAYLSSSGWITVPVTDKLIGTPDAPEDPIEHEFGDAIILQAATCSHSGEACRVCRLCGYAEYHTIPMAEHKFGAYEILQKPSAEAPGLRRLTCTVCSHSMTEEIVQLAPTDAPSEKTEKPTVAPDDPEITPKPTAAPPSGGDAPRRSVWPWILMTAGILFAGILLYPDIRHRIMTKK